MMINIEFIVCYIKCLKKFSVLKVSQKYFRNWLVKLCPKVFYNKNWYIIIFTLEVENA
jgi:hypothetical protein